MSVFDTINIHTECPKCGRINGEGQTKQLGSGLETFKPGDYVGTMFRYVRFYQICDSNTNCQHFYYFTVNVNSEGILGYKSEVVNDK